MAEEEEVSKRVRHAVIMLWGALTDRDKALGDLYAALKFVLEETGYMFRGDDAVGSPRS